MQRTSLPPFPDGFCIADPPGWERRKKKEEGRKKNFSIEDHIQAGRPSSLVVGEDSRAALGCEGAFGTFGTFQKYMRIEKTQIT